MRRISWTRVLACMLIAVMALSSAALLTGCGGGSKGGENGEVRVYCLGDYFDPDIVGDCPG